MNISEDVKWLRAPYVEELIGDLEMFKDGIEPADIKQGDLGNGYFLCSIASLAEDESRIKKLFLHEKRNQSGIYGLCIHKDGVRQSLYIDNFVPTLDKKLIFSRAHGKETWVIMLEKAWAKLHGSYERI